MKDLFKGSLTIPNLLTVIRIILVPVFAVLFYRGYFYWAVFVLFLSGLTDFLDGKIARRFNQISDLGKILDPIADKLTQITIAVMLFFEFRKPEAGDTLKLFSWVFLLFLAKEGFMLVGGAYMLSRGIRPGASEILGKVATFVFYSSMLLIMAFGPTVGAFVRNAENPLLELPEWLVMVLVGLSAALTIAALLGYAPGIAQQFREKAAEKNRSNES